ncbi:hypothetical protein BC937DRAFT_87290, partial [Endogone sp. FLAS-F59071]
TLDWIKH